MRAVILSVVLSWLVVGCASPTTNSDPKLSNQAWPVMARILASHGTFAALKAHPELKEEFELAVVALDNLIMNDEVDPKAVLEALQKLDVDELRSEYGVIYILDGIALYDGFFGDTIRLKKDSQLRGIVQGIRDGIFHAILF